MLKSVKSLYNPKMPPKMSKMCSIFDEKIDQAKL